MPELLPEKPEKLTHSEQARINGSKSKGPTSIEGKANSSRNSLKHGFAAVINVVLTVENSDDFLLHVDGFKAGFRPQDYVEQTMVEELAAISWRKARLIALETSIIDAQVSSQDPLVRALHPREAGNPYFHLLLAWQSLSQKPPKPTEEAPALDGKHFHVTSLELVRRYQVTLDRQYRNAMLNLRQYRKDFAQTPEPLPVPPPPQEPKIETPNEPSTSLPKPPQSISIRPVVVPIRPISPSKPATESEIHFDEPKN